MVSLYDELLGDWGDLFASEKVDDGCDLQSQKYGKDSSILPDLLADEDFSSVDLAQDYLGQSEWMTTFTDLLNVPVDPVEEILQQAERMEVIPEAVSQYQLSDDQERIIQEILHEPERSPSPVDEVPALISFSDISADQFSPLTPPLSPDDIESILSDPSSPLSDVSDISSSVLDDPDWSPHGSDSPTKVVRPYVKLRPKPYEKTPVLQNQGSASVSKNKKERKREQNKNAAIRYREKKRAESEVIAGEEKALDDKNKSLKKKVESMTNEISYLKDLLKEVYRAKGLKLDQKLLS